MFESSTPKDIATYAIEDVLKLLPERTTGLPSAKVRLNYIKMIYKILGFDLSPDVALSSVAEPQSLLVLAPAGGGKTTWSQIKAIEQKMIRKSRRNPELPIRGESILCLVYNKYNVEDMKQRHAQLVHKIQAYGVKGLNIDDRINACTFHSFCDFWRTRYVARMGLVGFTLLPSENDSIKIMKRAINIACEMSKKSKNDYSAAKFLALYNLQKESLKELFDLTNTDAFLAVDAEEEFIELVFQRYDAAKRLKHKYDFVDVLYKLYEILSSDENARKEVQGYYEYVIADESQDFTPLMWELLKLFVGDNTPLVCIGDEDQTIYNFRGADVNYLLNFTDNFNDAEVFALETNRRCPQIILDEAKRVISKNALRFDKNIVGVKDGGNIEYIPYSTTEGQIINVVNRIKSLSNEEQENTLICFRENSSSALLTDLLEEEGVIFHTIKGYAPLSHELYNHFISVLNILEMPYDREVLLNLYKVLPCSKSALFEVLGYDAGQFRFKTEDEKKHFLQIDYGKLIQYEGFPEALAALAELSSKIATQPLKEIVPTLFALMQKYFWKFKKSQNNNAELDTIFEKRIYQMFCSDLTYSSFFQEFQRRKGVFAGNSAIHAGVAVSTFHSLKGLEYDHVYIIDMNDSIFPCFSRIDGMPFPATVREQLKEAETRLWYVALTRAKKDVTIFYQEDNPSIYVAEALNLRKDINVFDVTKIASGVESEDFVFDDFVEDDDFVLEENMDFVGSSEDAAADRAKNAAPEKSNLGLEELTSFSKEETDKLISESSNSYFSKLISSL